MSGVVPAAPSLTDCLQRMMEVLGTYGKTKAMAMDAICRHTSLTQPQLEEILKKVNLPLLSSDVCHSVSAYAQKLHLELAWEVAWERAWAAQHGTPLPPPQQSALPLLKSSYAIHALPFACVGREKLLQDLIRALRYLAPERIVALQGPSLIGKSYVAYALAHRFSQHMEPLERFDALIHINLPGTTSAASRHSWVLSKVPTVEFDGLIASTETTWEVESGSIMNASPDQRLRKFRKYLARQGRCLIILENGEVLADHHTANLDAALVPYGQFLNKLPSNVHVLLTTRLPIASAKTWTLDQFNKDEFATAFEEHRDSYAREFIYDDDRWQRLKQDIFHEVHPLPGVIPAAFHGLIHEGLTGPPLYQWLKTLV